MLRTYQTGARTFQPAQARFATVATRRRLCTSKIGANSASPEVKRMRNECNILMAIFGGAAVLFVEDTVSAVRAYRSTQSEIAKIGKTITSLETKMKGGLEATGHRLDSLGQNLTPVKAKILGDPIEDPALNKEPAPDFIR
ncbi:hypothetical protein Dda_3620 [Drechslerella dactyloides]|uniref:Uncharacterized protein n=1 Tax=Drechslerella dactyloides TaxID=74499 RepID=A0AAD6IZT8_DREDA|nr:hypothetical protein Dda_3620 [Drechslerella dactyloides]